MIMYLTCSVKQEKKVHVEHDDTTLWKGNLYNWNLITYWIFAATARVYESPKRQRQTDKLDNFGLKPITMGSPEPP